MMRPAPPVEIALIATHVAPARGYGGVAESTARLAQAWSAAGRPFRLCASDASRGERLRAGRIGLPPAVTVTLYRAGPFPRWGFGLGAPWRIFQACRGARAVYVNGIATWPTTLAGLWCRILRRPFVVAPRGGLLAPHVAEIRRTRPHKWLFYRLLTLPTLRAARIVHVTSAFEAEGVLRLLPQARLAMAGNGLDLAAWPRRPLPPAGPGRVFCTLGRLEPDKGVLGFLRLWLECRGAEDRLFIAGSGPEAYVRDIDRLAARSEGAVLRLGGLDAEGVRALLARSEVLVLPSGLDGGAVRENFGNVVAEALATGRPVLVGRGLAWDGLEAAGCGVLFDAGGESVRAAIRHVQALPPAALEAMAAAARAYAEARLDLTATADRVWRMVAGMPLPPEAAPGD